MTTHAEIHCFFYSFIDNSCYISPQTTAQKTDDFVSPPPTTSDLISLLKTTVFIARQIPGVFYFSPSNGGCFLFLSKQQLHFPLKTMISLLSFQTTVLFHFFPDNGYFLFHPKKQLFLISRKATAVLLFYPHKGCFYFSLNNFFFVPFPFRLLFCFSQTTTGFIFLTRQKLLLFLYCQRQFS